MLRVFIEVVVANGWTCVYTCVCEGVYEKIENVDLANSVALIIRDRHRVVYLKQKTRLSPRMVIPAKMTIVIAHHLRLSFRTNHFLYSLFSFSGPASGTQ